MQFLNGLQLTNSQVTISGTTAVSLFSYPTSTLVGGELMILAEQGSAKMITKLLFITDGTATAITDEYATITIGTFTDVPTFYASYLSGTCTVFANCPTSTTYKTTYSIVTN